MDIASRIGVAELSRLYKSGAVSPVEVVEHTLRRIDRLDPQINSYVTVTAEYALARAKEAEAEIHAGRKRGPLHGVPFAAKDLLDTRGIRTMIGSQLMVDNVPEGDATIIRRLSDAGAVMVGKAGLHEWVYGITSTNPHFGAIHNPWDLERIPGGSSGGSTASLAAGLCSFSIGSDTGGSIRIPAALCGVAGLKPTFGTVNRQGAYPLADTLDTLGPFGLCVEDLALVHAVIADQAPPRVEFARQEPRLAGVTVGVPDRFYWEHLVPDVDRATRAALKVFESLEAEVREVPVPDIEVMNRVQLLTLKAEASSVHRGLLEDHAEDIGADVRALLEQGCRVLATEYLEAQRERRVLCREFEAAFNQADVLVMPAVPIPTAHIGQKEIAVLGRLENVRMATTRNIRSMNLPGVPVVSVPCGFHADGLPIGLQVAGPRLGEAAALKVAHAYEQATDWHTRIPPLAQ